MKKHRIRMRLLIMISLSSLLWAVSGCGEKNPEAEKAAVAAAEAWLGLLDDGEYARTWTEAASVFKASTTQQGWAEMIKPVHAPLGEVHSRKLRRATYSTSVPGAPEGEYVIIQYVTDYANKKGAVETITPMLDKDGQWRVSGYFIK